MSLVRTALLAIAIATATALPAASLPGASPSSTPDAVTTALDGRCATSDRAAGELISDRVAEVVPAVAADLPIRIAVDPVVPPGIPHALLVTPAGICTTEAFNLALAPTLDGPTAVATAFASTAGMPWLGEVEVRDVLVRDADGAVDGVTVTLTTVGGRHDVTSAWTVRVDARGIREAAFETVRFGGGGGEHATDVHHLEGITSLPGHRRTWTRDAAGMLRVDATIQDLLAADLADRGAAEERAARAAGLAPGDFLQGTLDGQIIRFSLGVVAEPVEAVPTGQALADRLLVVSQGMQRIYDQYADWGATDVWGATGRSIAGSTVTTFALDDVGYVNFNSGLSEVCLACAYLTDAIEIHVTLAFAELTEGPLLGVDYPDDNSYTLEVVGHEFTHAVQGGYGDGDVGLTNAFYEATATSSQALFHEAENSAQRGSIEYLDSANGCEGFENGRGGWISAQAAGPFTDGHTYDACYLWWTYMARHGGEGLVRLMEALPGVRDRGTADIDRHLLQLDLASTVGDGTTDLARWAAAYTAGTSADGYRITDGSGDVHDWFALLTPAERARDLRPGEAVAVSVAAGGTAGFRVVGDGVLTQLPAGAEAFAFEVVEGRLSDATPVGIGSPLRAGAILAVVAPTAATNEGAVAIG